MNKHYPLFCLLLCFFLVHAVPCFSQQITGRKYLRIGEIWHEDEDIPAAAAGLIACPAIIGAASTSPKII